MMVGVGEGRGAGGVRGCSVCVSLCLCVSLCFCFARAAWELFIFKHFIFSSIFVHFQAFSYNFQAEVDINIS